MVRLLVLPLRFLVFPFRFAAGSARAGFYAGRAVGISRSAFFGLGFASGVLVASPKARKATFVGLGRLVTAAVNAQKKAEVAPTPEPVVPDPAVAAPHGVLLTDLDPVDPLDPTGPVLPTD